MSTKVITISLPPDVVEQIRYSGKIHHEKISEWIKRAAIERLERLHHGMVKR
jgi:hypothetical protein